jgi:tellurite resistance protein TehA-like permease
MHVLCLQLFPVFCRIHVYNSLIIRRRKKIIQQLGTSLFRLSDQLQTSFLQLPTSPRFFKRLIASFSDYTMKELLCILVPYSMIRQLKHEIPMNNPLFSQKL